MWRPVEDLAKIAEHAPHTEKALPDSSYTSEERAIITVMGDKAEGLNFKAIGNAHVLMALCMDPSGKAQKALEMLNVDPGTVPAKIIQELEDLVPAKIIFELEDQQGSSWQLQANSAPQKAQHDGL